MVSCHESSKEASTDFVKNVEPTLNVVADVENENESNDEHFRMNLVLYPNGHVISWKSQIEAASFDLLVSENPHFKPFNTIRIKSISSPYTYEKNIEGPQYFRLIANTEQGEVLSENIKDDRLITGVEDCLAASGKTLESYKILFAKIGSENCYQIFETLPLLEELDLSNSGIEELSPLRFAKSIRSLYLLGNEITEVSALSSLESLEVLDLSMNPELKDISGLSQLTSLKALSIAGGRVENLGPLKLLSNLENLNLSKNPIVDLRPLKTLSFKSKVVLDGVVENFSKSTCPLDFSNQTVVGFCRKVRLSN